MSPRIPRSVRPPVTLGWGIALAAATAVISGFAIFLNGFAVKQLPDPAVYTTLKNGVAAALLVALAAGTIRPAEVRCLRRRTWAGLLVVGIVGGSIPFVLFFSGLAQASAPSAAFIHKTLFVWVAMLAVPLLGERLGWAQLAAIGLLLGGQLLIAPPNGVVWGTGETMIGGATLLWAAEVVIAKRLLGAVAPQVVGAARLGFGLVLLVGYLGVSGRLATVSTLSYGQWAWALATGLVLAAYVATWLAALRRAPASLVTSVLVAGAPITAALHAISTGTVPSAGVVGGHVVVLTGAAALVVVVLRAARPSQAAVQAGSGVG